MKQKATIESLPFGQFIKSAADILEKSSGRELPARELVELLGKGFDCKWGTCWQTDENSRVLRAVAIWNKDTINLDKLRRDTENRVLCLDEGNAGHVWRSGKPVCTSNLILDMCLPRSLDATDAGLKVGIWFPIKTEEITFGVVELLGKHYWRFDERFFGELTALGLELGRAFRKRALEGHRTSGETSFKSP